MNPTLRDVLLALPPHLLGLALTWRLIWPRWKVPGKTAFSAYFLEDLFAAEEVAERGARTPPIGAQMREQGVPAGQ